MIYYIKIERSDLKMTVEIENNTYEIIKDYKNGYNKDEFINKYTEYFNEYDYIVGDWAYGKLRLKGFNDKNNKKVKDINNYDKLDEYLSKNCAFDCAYFVAKRKNV